MDLHECNEIQKTLMFKCVCNIEVMLHKLNLNGEIDSMSYYDIQKYINKQKKEYFGICDMMNGEY